MNVLKEIWHALGQYREFRRALAELHRLSARELEDLGLSRHRHAAGDFIRVAYGEAERRMATPAAAQG
jgi:hypothetical protein